jgi:hypothetical protein
LNVLLHPGHDYFPISFSYSGGALSYGARLDNPVKKEAQAASAMAKFRTMDTKGTVEAANVEVEVNSTHQNAIAEVHSRSFSCNSMYLLYIPVA